jgi:phosphatidylglycerophosphatase A
MPALSPLTAHLPLRQRLILFLSSSGGLGYLPLAPGTWGSLMGLPLWWAMAQWPAGQQAIAVGVLTILAILISGRAEAIYKSHDVQHIVIDEVVGMMTTGLLVPFAWPQVLVGFGLFRLLDAAKPWPICLIDRRMPGGAGVVLDDTLAGFFACGLLHAAHHFLGGWW